MRNVFRCAEFHIILRRIILISLVERGYKVAICEQMEDAKQTKGMVRREVVQLITPGTKMDGKNLSEKENNYIATITDFTDDTFGFAYTDLSTGESKVTLMSSFEEVINEFAILGASEVVLASDFNEEWKKKLQERGAKAISFEDVLETSESFTVLLQHLKQEKQATTTTRLFSIYTELKNVHSIICNLYKPMKHHII